MYEGMSHLATYVPLHWSLQKKTTPENEGVRYTGETPPVDRGILLGTHSNDPSQWALLRGAQSLVRASTSTTIILEPKQSSKLSIRR